ncbi:Biotin synthase [Fundidesulfovibrio magnetotacticus]|uniref:Biotin synthase n=1 Tax=Fundidesulfovibrio magnetotacticus TaxID=2730080 RepID=A0A6V8LN92_9BACT|nr:biotin synthase BioB [Fundidesulfovibrio magnetotacticus]GFK92490.1 Biotin synthase [Fundidesulfovibrio magnetotacticus]
MIIGNRPLHAATTLVLDGQDLRGELLHEVITVVAQARGEELADLLGAARRIRLARLGRAVSLCAIVNARSGRCSENCAFCAQSSHFDTGAPCHPFLDHERILDAARTMRAHGARRFGIVLSGLTPSREDFERLRRAVRGVADLGMLPDASCGILSRARFEELRSDGLHLYHHNLETARSFFPEICTTHDYEDDVQAVRDALDAGLGVCSGGIFGLGESWEQRAELALTLRELGVDSVPVNFLSPIPGTPMERRPPLAPEEALKIVALLRFILPSAHLRICGGRKTVFGPTRGLAPLEAGASGLMIGDYLTTSGLDAAADRQGIRDAGWEIEDA